VKWSGIVSELKPWSSQVFASSTHSVREAALLA